MNAASVTNNMDILAKHFDMDISLFTNNGILRDKEWDKKSSRNYAYKGISSRSDLQKAIINNGYIFSDVLNATNLKMIDYGQLAVKNYHAYGAQENRTVVYMPESESLPTTFHDVKYMVMKEELFHSKQNDWSQSISRASFKGRKDTSAVSDDVLNLLRILGIAETSNYFIYTQERNNTSTSNQQTQQSHSNQSSKPLPTDRPSVGLPNPLHGSYGIYWCYMNSVAQLIHSAPQLENWILENSNIEELKALLRYMKSPAEVNFEKELEKITKKMNDGESKKLLKREFAVTDTYIEGQHVFESTSLLGTVKNPINILTMLKMPAENSQDSEWNKLWPDVIKKFKEANLLKELWLEVIWERISTAVGYEMREPNDQNNHQNAAGFLECILNRTPANPYRVQALGDRITTNFIAHMIVGNTVESTSINNTYINPPEVLFLYVTNHNGGYYTVKDTIEINSCSSSKVKYVLRSFIATSATQEKRGDGHFITFVKNSDHWYLCDDDKINQVHVQTTGNMDLNFFNFTHQEYGGEFVNKSGELILLYEKVQ